MKTRAEITRTFRSKYEQLRSSFSGIGPLESNRISRIGDVYVCDLGQNGRAAFVMYENGNIVEVHGGIYEFWKQKGGANGELGLPVSDEADYQGPDARPGDRVSEFENGIAVWRADTRQTEVRDKSEMPVCPSVGTDVSSSCEEEDEDVKLLVDCGGSGIKIRRYVQGELRPDTHRFKPKSLEECYKSLEEMARGGNSSIYSRVTGIAISICGKYDYVNEKILTCYFYPFLVGRLKAKLKERFRCENVHIVNDGDAHVLALKSIYEQNGLRLSSAINLSLGTSVGFGILDPNGNLLHTRHGHNWEVSNWRCDTRASNKMLYWALGSNGLQALEKQHGSPKAFIYYGERLCHFLGHDLALNLNRNPASNFRPKTIGLSGGIVVAHYNDIEEGIRRECEKRGYCASGGPLDGVDIYLSTERDSVMRGLVGLLDCGECSEVSTASASKDAFSKHSSLLRKLELKGNAPSSSGRKVSGKVLRNCNNWERTIPVNRPCALLAVNVGQAVCAENGGRAPLVANRQTCGGSWETFIIVNNDDGSFSLKSAANDKFVSAFPDGRMIAQGSVVDAWEKFDLKPVQGKDGVFTLWSRNTQKYVSVDENKGRVLIADRDVADTWEEFRIFCL